MGTGLAVKKPEARIDYVGPAPQDEGDWGRRFRSVRNSSTSLTPSLHVSSNLLVSFLFLSPPGSVPGFMSKTSIPALARDHTY